MRVFLDTNVLVSGFATRGLSADVVRHVMAEHDLVLAEVVLTELRRVLLDKFGLPARRVGEIEVLLRRYPVEPRPTEPTGIEVRDIDDAWVLASALAAEAEVLVTGDKDLLDVQDEVDALRILTPRAFWEAVRG
ncbi:MAG: putative toxin-antitoxin system toxin component, PIN family [Bacteroidota bacterium]